MQPTHTTQQPLKNLAKNWQATGRVAIQHAKQMQNTSFTWQQTGGAYTIHLYSPLATASVTINGDQNSFAVVTNNAEQDAELDRSLPFPQMAYWLRGLAAPASATQSSSFNSVGQLHRLQQDSWLIEYQSYQSDDLQALPERLTISNGSSKIKLFIKEFRELTM